MNLSIGFLVGGALLLLAVDVSSSAAAVVHSDDGTEDIRDLEFDEEVTPCGAAACNPRQDCITSEECSCKQGYFGVECAFLMCGNSACNQREECVATSVGEACACKIGYAGVNCHDDYDECLELNPKPCSFSGGYCENRWAFDGFYACGCDTNSGWKDGTTPSNNHGATSCMDVDECSADDSPCHLDATCTNWIPGYDCVCNQDFSGDGVTSCDPTPPEVVIAACEAKNCDEASSYCEIDANDIPQCLCKIGFSQLRPDSGCKDIDECQEESACPEHAECQNHDGGFECLCLSGYDGGGDFCSDVNECDGPSPCPDDFQCVNTIGSFDCVIAPSAMPSLSPSESPTRSPVNPIPATQPEPLNSVTVNVAAGGGTVSLTNIAQVTFLPGAFDSANTAVTVTTSNNPAVNGMFEESSSMFRPGARLFYEVEIFLASPPLTETVEVDLSIPPDFAAMVPDGFGIETFALIEQSSILQEAFSIFVLLSCTEPGKCTLPANAFSDRYTTDDSFVAILTMAPTPGTSMTTNRRQLRGRRQLQQTCEASSIRCPVGGGCVVTSPFNKSRKHPVTGVVRPHYGVDYRAATGTPVLAASAGTIERSYPSTSYGETVIIRHTNGAASLYAHLQSRSVAVGDTVTLLQQIGNSGSTGLSSGPHLHFEYVPNGAIIQSKNRIDPDACVGVVTSGSITAGDNGNLADDSFRLSLDGIVIGETTIGGTNNLSINNIIPGVHTLTLLVLVAPDNVGTYFVQLNDGLTFVDGGTERSDAPSQGTSVSWQINVPTDP
mmetsp:Transcript_33176/g.54770  ORF Transcript_33176/g.54770 Transcript_33176/m.54770 type:complete len:780 (+) Transcript_33176:77-2416(+)|eukprot:CAMPEP_0119022270 /NCGR_PEP_ID=MMETSP1176-20130426/27585_1 /TAXON_ID=265551 /ORGANISM="Synedropsis recta cf, Strain CCMP1620" /LENGTH=779 /DNA_ID=CAMNT_0006977059 /DNA_START=66 /DNA_END=2405 /DNA_ORIENTATION=+